MTGQRLLDDVLPAYDVRSRHAESTVSPLEKALMLSILVLSLACSDGIGPTPTEPCADDQEVVVSASPDQVGPLPFHGMSGYPYRWPERYPLTIERQRYLEKYNTRIVTSQLDRIAGLTGFTR